MGNQSIPTGVSVPIEVTPLVDRATLALKTGVAVKMKVRRKSDGFVFDWDAGQLIFRTVGAVVQLLSPNFTEIDATNFPGEYALDFDLATYGGLNVQDVYEFTIIESGTSDVSNLPQSGEVRTGEAPSMLTATIDEELTTTHGAGSWQQSVVSGSALNVVPNSSSLVTIGTVAAGTYASTALLDSVYWQIQDVAGAIDMYFEFLIAADGIPTAITHAGRINGNGDDIDIFAWNWGTTTWEAVGQLAGKGGGSDDINTYILFAQHVGTGADLGKVRVRYQSTGLSSANFYSDQVVLSYSVINRSVGYADGAIWVDTINGSPGAIVFINGVADNPVNTWADALLLSAALGIRRFRIAGGSTITLTANSDYFQIIGAEYTLNLGGQSIVEALFVGANVAGTSTGLNARFLDCRMGTVSLTQCGFGRCAIIGPITLLTAGTYLFEGCFSAVAGTGTPSVDFGAALGDTNLNMRHYSGGIEVLNMGQAGTDNMSLEGHGQLVLNVNCAGGTIAIRGAFPVTDNAGGAVTLSDDARFAKTDLLDYMETSGTNPHGTGGWDATATVPAQTIRDAMKLAPTGGAPAAGSVDEHLDDILADTTAIDALVTTNLDATISSIDAAITLLATDLTLVLGLVQQNFVLDSTTYNSAGLLTSGRIRLFSSKAAAVAATDGGVAEGEFAEYTISSVAEVSPIDMLPTIYKVVKEP